MRVPAGGVTQIDALIAISDEQLLVLPMHPILSRIGASGNPGAVHVPPGEGMPTLCLMCSIWPVISWGALVFRHKTLGGRTSPLMSLVTTSLRVMRIKKTILS